MCQNSTCAASLTRVIICSVHYKDSDVLWVGDRTSELAFSPCAISSHPAPFVLNLAGPSELCIIATLANLSHRLVLLKLTSLLPSPAHFASLSSSRKLKASAAAHFPSSDPTFLHPIFPTQGKRGRTAETRFQHSLSAMAIRRTKHDG